MRWRRCAVVVTLACGCWHPIPWTPEGQRLADEREGREGRPHAPVSVAQPNGVEAIEPHHEYDLEDTRPPDDAQPPAQPADAGAPDGGLSPKPPERTPGGAVMSYRPTVLTGVRIGPGEEWTAQGYSDHGLPIGAEATCPPKRRLVLTVTDERGGVTRAGHLMGIYVARKQDVGGYFTVRLKNDEPEPVICDVKIIALLVADP